MNDIPEPEMSDDELLLDLSLGDAEKAHAAFDVIKAKYGKALYMTIKNNAYGRKLPVDIHELTKDIFQETLVRFFELARQEKLELSKPIIAFLRGISNKVMLECIKTDMSRREVPFDVSFIERSDIFLVEHEVVIENEEELNAALNECLEKLSEYERRYIRAIMDEFEDPPKPREIAKRYSVSANTVSNRLTSAKRKLDDCLNSKNISTPRSRA